MEKTIKITESKLQQIVNESVKKFLNESTYNSPIEKWNYWCTNFNDNFIEEVWKDNPNMAQHLKNKFMAYYDVVGPYGVMLKFYLNLDGTNREILENYVLNNNDF